MRGTAAVKSLKRGTPCRGNFKEMRNRDGAESKEEGTEIPLHVFSTSLPHGKIIQ